MLALLATGDGLRFCSCGSIGLLILTSILCIHVSVLMSKFVGQINYDGKLSTDIFRKGFVFLLGCSLD